MIIQMPMSRGVRHVVLSGGQQPSIAKRFLGNPTAPLPSFVEGWALNSFVGLRATAPSAQGIPTDSMDALQLEYTVSGTAGASTLTIDDGDEDLGTGHWAGVILHDDGTYGIYGVSGLADGECTIFPTLRATVTEGTLRNLGGGVNGQHYTEPGYKALAHHIYNTTRRSAYRSRWVARWDSRTGVAEDWTDIGSGPDIASQNNWINDENSAAFLAFVSRDRQVLRARPGSPYTGKGITKSFDLKGQSGVFEMFVSAADIVGENAGFYSVRVVVEVDEQTVLDETYEPNEGLVRVLVDYPSGSTGTVTITAPDETWVTFVQFQLDSVTWWVYDRSENGFEWSDSVIDPDAKTVIIGDSWTTFYPEGGSGVDGVLGTELQSLMTGDGGSGTVVSVGEGGTTAEFGLTVFDSLVAPENPEQVIILYFTNDHNQYGDNGFERWITAMYRLGIKCQKIGARPIFVMPLPTSSLSQAIGHGIWAAELGRGIFGLAP